MRLNSRIGRVEDRLGGGDDGCPACRGLDVVMTFRRGEPEPEAPTCEQCGRAIDVVLVEEVIVATREEVAAIRAEREVLG